MLIVDLDKYKKMICKMQKLPLFHTQTHTKKKGDAKSTNERSGGVTESS
jgi:hypothetical protein